MSKFEEAVKGAAASKAPLAAAKAPEPEPEPEKPASSSSEPPANLMDKFKPKAGSWECQGCFIRQSADVIQCPACQTAKPGHEEEVKKKAEASKPSVTFGSGGGISFGNLGGSSAGAPSGGGGG